MISAQKLYHIKWPRNKTGYRTTVELAEEFPITLILKPCIPFADPSREDTVTPRVCFATTLEGAYGSLNIPLSRDYYIGIYKPIELVTIVCPYSNIMYDKQFFVHDAEKWGEVWSLRPVRTELQRIIIPSDSLV